MDSVAAEIPQEIPVLLDHGNPHPLACQKVTWHHSGGTAADHAAGRREFLRRHLSASLPDAAQYSGRLAKDAVIDRTPENPKMKTIPLSSTAASAGCRRHTASYAPAVSPSACCRPDL